MAKGLALALAETMAVRQKTKEYQMASRQMGRKLIHICRILKA